MSTPVGLLVPTVDFSSLRGAASAAQDVRERSDQAQSPSVPTFDQVLTDTVPALVAGAWTDDAFFWSAMQVREEHWVAGEVTSTVPATPRRGLLLVALVSAGLLGSIGAGAIAAVVWAVEHLPALMPS